MGSVRNRFNKEMGVNLKEHQPRKDHVDNNDLLQDKSQLELFVKARSKGTSKCDNK